VRAMGRHTEAWVELGSRQQGAARCGRA